MYQSIVLLPYLSVPSCVDTLNEVRGRIVNTEARLVECHKDVKIMETYIGRLKELNFQEELGIEQNELDDVATMQFSRKGDN